MATDVRKHKAPIGTETPRRQAFNDLSLSVCDVVPVANVTERTQLAADLTAAGFAPSAAHPLYVFRADAGAGLENEYTRDGATWRTVASMDLWLPRHGAPAASQTLTPNSVAMQDVTGMAFDLTVGTWAIDVHLGYSSPAAADIKIGSAFSGTTSTPGVKHCIGSDVGTTNVLANPLMRTSVHNSVTAIPYGHDGTATSATAFEAHKLIVTIAGTFKIQAAQNTANAGNTVVNANSYMVGHRVA